MLFVFEVDTDRGGASLNARTVYVGPTRRTHHQHTAAAQRRVGAAASNR
jgi:hypothetical protein